MKIALIGNQNSGKTTLFNCLTGMNAKIGNWPGVTIEQKVGIIKGTNYELVDLPGIYSLMPYSIEEEISSKYIFEENPDLIINIIDATSLERSLYLTTQLLDGNCNIIIALNMVDKLKSKGAVVDTKKLEDLLGIRVFKISALKKEGIEELINSIKTIKYPKNQKHLPEYLNKNYSIEQYEKIASQKYEYIEGITKSCLFKDNMTQNISSKLDNIFLNKWIAFPIFALIMFFIYYLSVGVLGESSVKAIENIIEIFSIQVDNIMNSAGISKLLIDLVVNGIIQGVGAVLKFLPQLAILYSCISILESTGYMSRIALLLDEIFSKIGLSGKSLIPFILGTGCSVPGIMGTRIIENEEKRNKTIILTPFIPCSAKLPIITLFSKSFFPNSSGLIAVSLYFSSIIVILITSLILKKTVHTENSNTYISELPDYKIPSIKYTINDVFEKILAFIKRAGTVILSCSIILWFLLNFSIKLEHVENIKDSILAFIGSKISWIFYPMLGKNSWEATVSIIQGLIAKEQVISSMAIINHSELSVRSGIFGFFTPSSAYAFMVFNLFSAPCFSAIAAMKKELGNNRTLIKTVAFEISLAWTLATIIYQIGSRIEQRKISIIDIIFIGLILAILLKIFQIPNKCSQCSYKKICDKNSK